jgi:hypothetical protein
VLEEALKTFTAHRLPKPSAKPETSSSILRAELERLSGYEAALALVLRNSDQHTGRLAERFVFTNWFGETPEEIEPEQQHIIALLKAYDEALDEVKSYAAERGQRAQRLTDILRIRRFLRTVKENEKGFVQLLGMKPSRGTPVVQDRRDKILEKALEIDRLRSEGLSWKKIGRALGTTPQAAKRLHEREVSNLPEARIKNIAKEIAARMKQKPLPIGKAKARSAALGKEITEQNRRAAKASRRSQSKKPAR